MNIYSTIHDHLFALLHEVRSRLARIMKENDYNIAPMHHKALAVLFHQPGITQQDLSVETGRDKSQISRLIRELEIKDLINRTQDENDKRIIRLTLNEQGNALFQEIRQHETKIIKSLLVSISDEELKVLNKTLYKIRKTVQHTTRKAD